MLLYLLFGFLLGSLIPFIASRLGKLIPADPGLLLLKMFHIPRFPKSNSLMHRYHFFQKWKKCFLISLMWSITEAILFYACFYFLPSSYSVWGCIFCWILSISMVIDAKYWLLPDFFTIPLLLLGFAFTYQNQDIGTQASLMGALFGYTISVLSVLLMGIFSKNPQFGGGDAKMITALGSWLGILGLNYALILSFLLFVILNSLPIQRKGAFGPALGIASIIVFFILYIK